MLSSPVADEKSHVTFRDASPEFSGQHDENLLVRF